MKKLLLLIVPFLALSFAACDPTDKEHENVNGNENGNQTPDTKLVKSFALNGNENSEYYYFTYDNNGRLIEMSTSEEDLLWTISYGANTITATFNNKSIDEEPGGDYATTSTITLDSEGYAVSCLYKYSKGGQSLATYTYNDGHISKISYPDDESNDESHFVWQNGNRIQKKGTVYEYDNLENKLNIELLTISTDELPDMLSLKGWTSKNNITKITRGENPGTSISYKFDSDGYPTEITRSDGEQIIVSYY